MPTKEEMFRGIVKVNNERIDSKVVAHSVTNQVPRDDSGRSDQPARVNRARPSPDATDLPRPKESLREFATRRKDEILSALEEVTDAEIRVELELKSLRDERHELLEEQKLLENMYGKTDKRTGTRHDTADAPSTVRSDKE